MDLGTRLLTETRRVRSPSTRPHKGGNTMREFKMEPKDWQRFWDKVDLGESSECWNWIGAKTSFGYGNFGLNGDLVSPHRLIWSKVNQQIIPKDMQICHTCDNPSCVNPNHLFLGSYQDNSLDAKKKGRSYDTHYVMLQCPICGEIFLRERRQTHLKKPDINYSFCSRSCSAKASHKDEFVFSENVLFQFKRSDIVEEKEDILDT